MKAWYAYEQNICEYPVIVFALTPGRARAIAMSTDILDGADFTRIRLRRMPDLDCLRDKEGEFDWYDPQTRIALVRDHGWACDEPTGAECANCHAKEWCEYRVDEEGSDE